MPTIYFVIVHNLKMALFLILNCMCKLNILFDKFQLFDYKHWNYMTPSQSRFLRKIKLLHIQYIFIFEIQFLIQQQVYIVYLALVHPVHGFQSDYPFYAASPSVMFITQKQMIALSANLTQLPHQRIPPDSIV